MWVAGTAASPSAFRCLLGDGRVHVELQLMVLVVQIAFTIHVLVQVLLIRTRVQAPIPDVSSIDKMLVEFMIHSSYSGS